MRYVLVTGAAGGMGKSCAEELRRQGFTVFAIDRRVGKAADGIIQIEADLTDESSVNAAYEKVASVTSELFAIIHFAGIYMMNSLVEMPAEDFNRIVDVNLFAAYLVNRIFMPMLRRGSRIVITTSELAPLYPLPFTGIYAITKGALDKYAYSLRMELQLLDISVSVLRAGAVDTDMLGASTTALGDFCENTALYSCNAERFKGIVESVEARRVAPYRIAKKVSAILNKRSPRFAYAQNRNPLLLLLNALPQRLQFFIIKKILK